MSAINLIKKPPAAPGAEYWQVNTECIPYQNRPRFWCGTNEFPGDHTGGETPDPIPHSEAKPAGPMIVLRGESRLSPGFMRPVGESRSAFPLLKYE